MKAVIKFEFQEIDCETQRIEQFTITLQTSRQFEIDLSALTSYCQGDTSTELPLCAIQALDAVLKHRAAIR